MNQSRSVDGLMSPVAVFIPPQAMNCLPANGGIEIISSRATVMRLNFSTPAPIAAYAQTTWREGWSQRKFTVSVFASSNGSPIAFEIGIQADVTPLLGHVSSGSPNFHNVTNLTAADHIQEFEHQFNLSINEPNMDNGSIISIAVKPVLTYNLLPVDIYGILVRGY